MRVQQCTILKIIVCVLQ